MFVNTYLSVIRFALYKQCPDGVQSFLFLNCTGSLFVLLLGMAIFPNSLTWCIFHNLLSIYVIFTFIYVVLMRLSKPSSFFSSLIPTGCPSFAILLILTGEIFSLCVRPVALYARPMVNYIIGHFLSCFGASLMPCWAILFAVAFFVYETIVMGIQWYVVNMIIGFTSVNK